MLSEKTKNIMSTGRRKTSVARIIIKENSQNPEIKVNDRSIENYFPSDILRLIVQQPLTLVKETEKYSIDVKVYGGGIKGQAEAIRHALARALTLINSEYRPALKKEKFLTRDPRMVERKKYGKRKARKRFQFSKR
ncbi:MAG: 30S ribosomal protein S9 [Chitinophagaceae bacterium]|nr:30S ribosomal protein S9 [Chitinophagaceae bacterium]